MEQATEKQIDYLKNLIAVDVNQISGLDGDGKQYRGLFMVAYRKSGCANWTEFVQMALQKYEAIDLQNLSKDEASKLIGQLKNGTIFS